MTVKMTVKIGDVATFAHVEPSKEQALKPLEDLHDILDNELGIEITLKGNEILVIEK